MVGAEECEEYLDWGLCYSIHTLIDSANLEKLDPTVRKQFSLICSVVDRVHDALNYLNNHDTVPRNDDGVLLYAVYVCILIDAVKQMHEAFGLHYLGADKDNPDNYQFFGDLIQGEPLCIPKEKLPTDDKFFEHFRSLLFAHPFESSRAKFLDKGEVRYSPFVIHGHSSGAAPGEEDSIGVRIYTNMRDDTIDFRVDFGLLKSYVKSRYAFLANVRDCIKGIVEAQNDEWRRNPINRSQSTEAILRDIESSLRSRCVDEELAKDALRYYTTPLTPGYPDNEKWVGEYRKLIKALLPVWCDRLDSLDHEGLYEAMEPLIIPRVPLADCYNYVGYQLEKISCHLGEDNAYGNWAQIQLKSFAGGFATEWVTITPEMSVDEAHLLVTVACFFEFNRYEMAHPESERPTGFPSQPGGAGIRRIVIGDLPKIVKTI